jgi:glycosyltransferase involved in cell wall biosynthesis
VSEPHGNLSRSTPRIVSVVIPVRNEAASIAETVRAVRAQAWENVQLEVIVVDDGSADSTADVARAAGARVIELATSQGDGNPAVARNRGAAAAVGDPLIFLDADCTPAEGWLAALLAAHDRGAAIVGGSLDLPPGLSLSARCDYYCGWYHVHSKRPAGYVVNHPPGNLSVRRELFLSTSGFVETQPIAFAHEELAWQAELQQRGHQIFFEPRAVVFHRNRPGFGNLLRRNYRWAYSAIESKAETGAARMSWVYRYPRTLIAASAPLAIAQTGYIVSCWVRAGIFEPVLMLPAVLSARVAYAAGMVTGGLRWLRNQGQPYREARPRWE